jgi:hypothetical protein
MMRQFGLGVLLWLLVGLLTGCGSSTAPGGLEGQLLAMPNAAEQPVPLPGAVIVINGPQGSQTTTTDAEGEYRFNDLAPGAYGLAASYQGPLIGTPLQPEERRLTISSGQDERISMVLLGEGITPPPAPADPTTPLASGGQPATGANADLGGITSNPFFWYWLFNQPGNYGYSRPPVVVRRGDRPITIDTNQPSRSPAGRPYTDYGQPGSVGVRTKPPPEVVSRGSTRPGAAPASGASQPSTSTGNNGGSVRPPSSTRPSGASPASGADSTSRGTTRPSGVSARPPAPKAPAARPPSGGRRR